MTIIRGLAVRVVTIGVIMTSFMMGWKAIMYISGCEPPLTVVVDDNMGPGFQQGDVLLLRRVASPLQCGDVILFAVEDGGVPIVHRVVHLQVSLYQDNGEVRLLTKGDSNSMDDRTSLYAKDQYWITQHEHVMGKVIGYIPYIGMVMIFINKHPLAKYLAVAAISILLLTKKNKSFG
ncbi:unnamed protein product [Amaranthus hypochondriacus]